MYVFNLIRFVGWSMLRSCPILEGGNVGILVFYMHYMYDHLLCWSHYGFAGHFSRENILWAHSVLCFHFLVISLKLVFKCLCVMCNVFYSSLVSVCWWLMSAQLIIVINVIDMSVFIIYILCWDLYNIFQVFYQVSSTRDRASLHK